MSRPLSEQARINRAQFIAAARDAGQSWDHIGMALNAKPETLANWWAQIGRNVAKNEYHRSTRAGTTQRECLRCGCSFGSEGRHNRMCSNCRSLSVSPMTPDPGGDTGRRVGRAR